MHMLYYYQWQYFIGLSGGEIAGIVIGVTVVVVIVLATPIVLIICICRRGTYNIIPNNWWCC